MPDEPLKLDETTREELEELGVDTSIYDASNDVVSVDSVLSYAAKTATADKIRLLLGAGADVRYVDPNGYSVLTHAVYRSCEELPDEHRGILATLIDAGAPLDVESSYGESALSVASQRGDFGVVAFLLERGADPTPLDWTPLFYEVAAGNSSGVVKLLDDGAALNERDAWERTPFLLAVHAGHQTIAALLLGRGSDRSATGRCGTTALMLAISRGDVAMLKWLIAEGFDIEETDDFGDFPLLEAARLGASRCVQALLDAHATADRRTEHGSTAISDAATPETVHMLVNAGEELGDIGSEMRVQLLKTRPGDDPVTEQDYRRHRHRIFGKRNPERMNNVLWDWLVRTRMSAYGCASRFDDAGCDRDPVWCFQRFGQSITQLPDGRYVEIGGEHEDYYDPDFCIYNDVVVHDNGQFDLYGYPEGVFPTTDFHSATLVWPHIYIIGNLGYRHQRRPGETPVYRLNCSLWSIERVQCQGHVPGWIHSHKARLVSNHQISIRGGLIDDGTSEELVENTAEFMLDLSDFTWTKQR